MVEHESHKIHSVLSLTVFPKQELNNSPIPLDEASIGSLKSVNF